uniref:Farnesyl pyrophosphate synthase n=1 Tax=Strigamia maritima TaxID=126957 RepID=T1IND5_STRMM
MRLLSSFHLNYLFSYSELSSRIFFARNRVWLSSVLSASHSHSIAVRSRLSQQLVPLVIDRRRLSIDISLMAFHMNEMEMKEFDAVYPDIVKSLTNDFMQPECEIKAAISRLKEVVDYNVPFGKKTRGLFVVKAFKQICGVDKIDEENVYLAQVLGWCVEMLQAFFLVCDDVMDQSKTRRGQLCWYKKDGVGLIAINDAFSLEAGLYFLLKKYFRHKSYYINIIELFHETTFQTVMGQSLDLLTSSTTGQLEFDKFTIETYNAIVKYKTAYYSFYLPIALAMCMAGITDQQLHNKAKNVLVEMGNLFQVQDDYIDCFGDPAITGKIGTDIEDGKCSWLIVTAFQLANPDQIAIIQENYRKSDPQCVAKVKNVYEKLQIPAVYEKYEEERYKEIVKLIDELDSDLPSNIFCELANAIYKRKR